MTIFSDPDQLARIRSILCNYIRLPFSGDTIPGAIMESVLANVREAEILNTYDFVDVVSRKNRCGWQVKSTKESTPVTWKRAKIPDAPRLIKNSHEDPGGLQALGNAIISFCNEHAHESLKSYDLEEIGYSRLLIHKNGSVTYFERLLCTRCNPIVFNPEEFQWKWSQPKKTKKKEQLQALHGFHRENGKKWWAWHGLGENQLHFSGEDSWWPDNHYPHTVKFPFPSASDKLSIDRFVELLEAFDTSS